MGMYAYINGQEIKLSGLLALAASNVNPSAIKAGTAIFSRDEVFDLAVELASCINNHTVQASNIGSVIEAKLAATKLLALLDWIDRTNEGDILSFE